MNALRDYLFRNFEQAFVLAILISIAGINYFIPYKLAFLNFYYIPILMAAYYLDVRRAVLGATFCIMMASIYFALAPASFQCGTSVMDIGLNLSAWAGFLILSAAIVGRLKQKLAGEILSANDLHVQLSNSHSRLEAATEELRRRSQGLEGMVVERTQMLEDSKQTVERLKNKVEETLFSTMDPEVAKLIIEERLRNEKRKISVMFCDLAGFTGYSEVRQPEVVIGDLNNYLGEMESVVMAYRGHIDKCTGDGLMVEFGAPVDYERHALLAVVAGLKMQERFGKARFPWRMRLGIATGDPIIGLIGRKRQMYTAIGDTVNLASRIQEISPPDRVTIDEATYHEVKGVVQAAKKTLLPAVDYGGPMDVRAVAECMSRLEAAPEDAELLKKTGYLLLQGKDFADAHEFFRKALERDPGDEKIKLAFADTSLQMETMGNIAVRGRRRMLHLYEVEALRNPLLDEGKVPRRLYNHYSERVRSAAEYPEELVLPVECLDGSVGISRVVGLLSYALADLLGLPDQEKREVLLAGYLADIGKTIVPHHLLNRAGSLDRTEFEEVKKHPQESVRVLRQMGFQSQALLDIVASHHEYLNGSGYPQGLAGERIPLGSRVIAVAEEYAAYVSWRPYRDTWNLRAAFSQIEKDTRKGKFAPEVTTALGQLLEL